MYTRTYQNLLLNLAFQMTYTFGIASREMHAPADAIDMHCHDAFSRRSNQCIMYTLAFCTLYYTESRSAVDPISPFTVPSRLSSKETQYVCLQPSNAAFQQASSFHIRDICINRKESMIE